MKAVLLSICLALGISGDPCSDAKSLVGKSVHVRWIDIVATDGGWRTVDEAIEWMDTEQDTVDQVGFLVSADGDQLLLSDSYFGVRGQIDQVIGYCVKIPCGTVLEINELK